jgi:hypothetical protein
VNNGTFYLPLKIKILAKRKRGLTKKIRIRTKRTDEVFVRYGFYVRVFYSKFFQPETLFFLSCNKPKRAIKQNIPKIE